MEKSPKQSYQFLDRNTEVRVVTDGIHPKTSAEMQRLVTERIPINRIETSYIQDCDALAGIFDGSIEESDHFMDGEARYEGPIDHAVYLDKSARNVRYLMGHVWDVLSEGELPKTAFLNIDKEDWLLAMGFPKTHNPDLAAISLDRLDPEYRKNMIARIRALALSPEDREALDEENLEEVWSKPTILDGKHVAIVDEVRSSGATLMIADMLLREAIPEAKFEPVYWSTPTLVTWNRYDGDGNVLGKEFAASRVPVWYDEHTPHGRGGIDDKAPERSLLSPDKFQRLGAYVLSTLPVDRETGKPLPKDRLSVMIQSDLKLLAKRFRNHEITYVPSGDRPDADWKGRIEEYYGIPYEEWRQLRRSA